MSPAEVSKPAQNLRGGPCCGISGLDGDDGDFVAAAASATRVASTVPSWSASLVTSVLTPSVTPVVTGIGWNAPSNIQTVPRVPAPLPRRGRRNRPASARAPSDPD